MQAGMLHFILIMILDWHQFVFFFFWQLVYDKIPRGDLQQRTIHLRVLSEGAFWENTLLGETIIQLKDLTPGHRWVGWHQLGTRGSDINC